MTTLVPFKTIVAAAVMLSACPVFGMAWRLDVVKGGVTNVVTAHSNPFAVEVRLTARQGAWEGFVANHEPGLRVIGLEMLSDPFAVDPERAMFYFPFRCGGRSRFWPRPGVTANGESVWQCGRDGIYRIGRETMRYPDRVAQMQFMTVNDGRRGWYVAAEDPKPTAKSLVGEWDSAKRRLRLGFYLRLWLGEHEAAEVPRLVMKAYDGPWRVAAKAYRAWWDTCHKVVPIREELKDMVGFMMVILKQQNDEIVWPYVDFPELGDALAAFGLGHVEFHGWGVGGHDKLYPEYDPDPAMGGRETLVREVARLRQRGFHVSVYANGQLSDPQGGAWFAKYGEACAMRRQDGAPYQEFWEKYRGKTGRRFNVNCPCAEAWKRQMLKVCRDGLALGFDGFFYDQIGNKEPLQCFAADHGHKTGAWVLTDDRTALWDGVYREIVREYPNAVLWSEAFNDTIFSSIGYFTSIRYTSEQRASVRNRFVANEGIDVYPELMFTVFPELIMTDRCNTPLVTRNRANGNAVTNLRTDLEVRYAADRAYVTKGVEPTVADYAPLRHPPSEWHLMKTETWRRDRDYFRCVNDFRRANRDLLLRGTFRADEGFEVKGGAKIVANRWDSATGESGILVWNADERPAAVEVVFEAPVREVSEPESGKVHAAAPIPANTLRLYRYGKSGVVRK